MPPEIVDEVSAAFSGHLLSPLLSTFLLIVVIVLVRGVIHRYILKQVESTDLQRKWLVQSRNALALLAILGVVIIWGQELRTLALSVVAIAVAFVVATKELILCVTGSILKTASRSFDIGDRIQVKDFRGDVIDQNMLATTILEVGPGRLTHQRTGRIVVIPNALFVSEPVVNESYTHHYVLHVFTVPFKRDEDWPRAQGVLLDVARKHCSPYLDEARRYLTKLSAQRGLDTPAVDPRVTLQTPSAGEVNLIVRFPVRPGERSQLEQSILSDALRQMRQPAPEVEDAVGSQPGGEAE